MWACRLVAQFQRVKPRGRPMPPHIARGNGTRAQVRARVEHVFAAQKHRMGLVIRTVGQLRAAAKIALANLTYNSADWSGWKRPPQPSDCPHKTSSERLHQRSTF
jgi:hypothetical protein